MKGTLPRDEAGRGSSSFPRHYHRQSLAPQRTWDEWIHGTAVTPKPWKRAGVWKTAAVVAGALLLCGIVTGLVMVL